MKKIILASQSPRRKQLLEWAEVPFEIVVKGTDETYPAGLSPQAIAIHIAREKGRVVKQEVEADSIVLAADTIVVYGDKIIGKPANREAALETLGLLSGNKHIVITGVVITKGKEEIAFSESTEVFFHELTREQIEYYVDEYKPYDKAGAYAIQEWIGVVGIRSVQGDFYNVMGLPVSRVVREINRLLG